MTDDLAAQAFALDLEMEDVVEGGDVAFHAADIGDLDNPPHAVTLALDLYDQVHSADDLGQDGARRQAHVAHLDHVLDPGQRIARGVRVDGGHAAIVAGVHRLQHVEGLAAADFADDDAVRTHAQGVADQIALRHFATALQAGDPGLHPDHVRLLQLQLGRVLDRYDSLADIDQPRQRIQQRRLARAGAARNDHVEARARGHLQQTRNRRRHRAEFDEPGKVDLVARELADRYVGTVERQRRKHDIDAGAVLQPCVHHRGALVDATPDPGRNPLAYMGNVRGIAEAHTGQFELATTFDEHLLRSVDHDVRDQVVFEQRLEGAEPQHVVDQLARERSLLATIKLNALLRGDLGQCPLDLLGQLLRGELRQRGRVHLAKAQRAQFDDRRTGRKFGRRRSFSLLDRRLLRRCLTASEPDRWLPRSLGCRDSTAIDVSIHAAPIGLNHRANCQPEKRLPPARPAR